MSGVCPMGSSATHCSSGLAPSNAGAKTPYWRVGLVSARFHVARRLGVCVLRRLPRIVDSANASKNSLSQISVVHRVLPKQIVRRITPLMPCVLHRHNVLSASRPPFRRGGKPREIGNIAEWNQRFIHIPH